MQIESDEENPVSDEFVPMPPNQQSIHPEIAKSQEDLKSMWINETDWKKRAILAARMISDGIDV